MATATRISDGLSKKKVEPHPKQEKPVAVARLPYQGAASHKVSRLLAKFNIQTVHIPYKNLRKMFMKNV
jgi:hypothetical protein